MVLQEGPVDADRGTWQRQGGSYIFQELIKDVPVSEDEDTKDVWITCVEIWSKWNLSIRYNFSSIDLSKTTISTSVPLPENCYTLYAFRQIHLTYLESQVSSWLPDCNL